MPVASRTRTRPDVPHRRRLVRFVTGSPLRSPRPICFGNPFGLSRYSPSRLSRCYRKQISRIGARCEREHHCVQGPRVAGSRTPGAGLRPRGKRSERRLTYGREVMLQSGLRPYMLAAAGASRGSHCQCDRLSALCQGEGPNCGDT